ncbi:hypothetical protein GCM10011368_00370 [Hyunsoonleella pacifica]|nr:hypothetical protein GCM10011368_00370 [Hyunsoonleella pacifica]
MAQLLINENKLEKGSHPTWNETENYLTLYGKESLPRGIKEALFFDFELTFKEFFKDFMNTLVLGFRQLGGVLVLLLIWPIISMLKSRKLNFKSFTPVIVILMIGIFSFIIISNVELRWLSPVFVLSLVWFSNLEHQKKLSEKYLVFNYLIFIVLVGYGSFRVLNKII